MLNLELAPLVTHVPVCLNLSLESSDSWLCLPKTQVHYNTPDYTTLNPITVTAFKLQRLKI